MGGREEHQQLGASAPPATGASDDDDELEDMFGITVGALNGIQEDLSDKVG